MKFSTAIGAIRLCIGASLAMGPRAEAATLPEEVARLAAPLVDASSGDVTRAVGLVVVVVTRSGNQVFGFGALRAGEAAPADGDTFFQVGSVSKTMTGLIFAAMVEESAGAIAPEQPVNSHLAPDLRVPDFQGQPITLGHLATHYGALPDFPNNMTGPPTSPALNYSRAQLATFLSSLTLGTAPGSAYSYSNVGFGVLGLALADRAGVGSFSPLLRNRVTTPLGMTDTGLNEPGFVTGLGARLAQGYRPAGGALVPVALSDMGVLESAGEVISTGRDLGTLLRALTGLAPFPVAGAVERVVAPSAPGPPGTLAGYGLDIRAMAGGVTQYEKAGLVAGYTTFVAFRREPAVGVAILSNRGQHQAIVALARQILALLPPPAVSVQRTAPDSMELSFPAAPRLSYELQTSTDLWNWSTLTTLTNSADTPATLSITLPLAPPRGFFQLRY